MQNAECTLKNAKTLFLFVSVVLVASLPSLVFAAIQSADVLPAPDLTLTPSDIVFSPENPVVGQPVNITAIVHNIGTATAKNITVDFYVDSIPIVQKVIDELSPDSQKNVSINFIFLSVGYHNVTVDIDANDTILESNEANNQATTYIPVAEIQTEPCSISLIAYPELIEANGFDTSTITAIVTDELGKRVSGTNVSFSTTLGTIDSPKTTTNGIATTILTSSLLAGTAVIEARAIVNDIPVSATIPVDCVKTAEAKCDAMWVDITIRVEKAIVGTTLIVTHTNVTVTNGVITIDTTPENAAAIEGNATANSIIYLLIEAWELEITLKDDAIATNSTVTGTISKIKLNTPPEFYITSKSEVGVAMTDLDVEFNARFTPANLELNLTLLEHYNNLKYFVPASGSEITENIIATFGIEGVTPSDIQKNTAILVHSELSGTFIENNVTGVPISIRVKKEWFDSVAEGDINKVTLFKISNNGQIDGPPLRPEVTIDSINDTATFHAAFDHFCVLALIAKPSKPVPPLPPSPPSAGGGGGGGYYYPYFTPAPPRDTTPPVISNITVIMGSSVTIVWETNEMSDSLVKCGRESGRYTIEKSDPNYVLFHSIHLEEIKEYAAYYFVVNSTDLSGNSAQTAEYIFIFTPPSKAGPIVKLILPSISYFIITFWWLELVAVIAAFIISFVIYKRYRASKERIDKLKLRIEEFKEIGDKVVSKALTISRAFADEFKEIRDKVVPWVKAGARKGKKIEDFVPKGSIRDVIRERRDMLTIKYTGKAKLPTQEPRAKSEQLLSKHITADEHVLNELEQKLVLSMDAYKFNIYFAPADEDEVLSMGENVEFEKGLLKIANEALWIIGRDSHKRIAGDDIVNVELKRRSMYKGTEYGAISIEYLDEGTSVISTIVITKGNTTEALISHTLELLNVYKIEEELPEIENLILRLMHAGALDLSPSALASTAKALGLSEEEFMSHLEHLSELGIIDLTNQTLRKRGIKYVIALSKKGTSSG